MSEQKQKRPAHEVILTNLSYAVSNLKGWADGTPTLEDLATDEQLYHIDALCRVLGDMVIPEDKRVTVSSTLWGLAHEVPSVPGFDMQAAPLLRATGDEITKDGNDADSE